MRSCGASCSTRRCRPLKDKTKDDIRFVLFRENTEGFYAGMGGNFKKGTPDEVASLEEIITREGVERIIRHAFQEQFRSSSTSS